MHNYMLRRREGRHVAGNFVLFGMILFLPSVFLLRRRLRREEEEEEGGNSPSVERERNEFLVLFSIQRSDPGWGEIVLVHTYMYSVSTCTCTYM